jgi:hypothetical protein
MGMRDKDGLASILKNKISSLLGSSFVTGRQNYYLHNGRKYPVKVISVGIDANNVNQMSAIDLKFHIIGKETNTGFEYIVLNPFQACKLATHKNPQHNGIVIENFCCAYSEFSQYKKYDDNSLDTAIKISIASWDINRNRKSLENYMMTQQKMRETINKNNVDYLNTII